MQHSILALNKAHTSIVLDILVRLFYRLILGDIPNETEGSVYLDERALAALDLDEGPERACGMQGGVVVCDFLTASWS